MNNLLAILNGSVDVFIILSLPIGYMSYMLARGMDIGQNDKKQTIMYTTLIFAFISTIAYKLGLYIYPKYFLPYILAIIIPLVCAVLWNKWIEYWLFEILYRTRISNRTRYDLIWGHLFEDTEKFPSQIHVFLKDGKQFVCDNTDSFKDSPQSAYLTDREKNILLHVTHDNLGSDRKITEAVMPPKQELNGEIFYKPTYISSDEIQRIELHYMQQSISEE